MKKSADDNENKAMKTLCFELAYGRVKTVCLVGEVEVLSQTIRQEFPGIVITKTDSLPSDGKFDAVVLWHYLGKGQAVNKLQAVKDIIYDNGLLFAVDYCAANPRGKLIADFCSACEKSDRILFSESEIVGLLERGGYKYPSVRRIGFCECFAKGKVCPHCSTETVSEN